MANIYVKSGGGAIGSGSYRGVWVAGSTWAVGDRIVANNVISYRVMECTTGGAGNAVTEPTWNTTTGGTTTDNAATFTTRIPDGWANATVDLTRAAANDAAGDTIYVSHQHAESTAAAISFAWAGSEASPVKVLCGDDSAEPPTALATTATVTTTGNNGITLTSTANQYVFWYGITFVTGSSGTSTASLTLSGRSRFEQCSFQLASTGGFSRINLGTAGAKVVVEACTFKFGAAGQGCAPNSNFVEVRGGSLLSGGTSPTNFSYSVQDCSATFDGVDLSNAAAAVNLVSGSSAGARMTFRNCKLPSSWSGSLHNGSLDRGQISEMFNCDSGDTNYRYRKATQFGTIQEETTLVRTGGASDGTTPISFRMVTNANAEYPMLTLDSQELFGKYISSVGSAVTLTVHILHDSATALNDDEVWLEVLGMATSGVPLGTWYDDSKADVLASAAAQTASSETWTTTGMANPNKQQLSVTYTPQEKGYPICVVKCAKASKTLYYCPKVEQS